MAGKVRKKRKPMGWRVRIMMVIIIMASMAAMPTSIMMLIGMMPTFAAFIVDRTSQKTRVVTIGAMNLAGCVPFILRLWSSGHTIDNAVSIVMDPRTIIVMYCAAGIGYIIDWTVSGLMINVMTGRASSRRTQIEKQKAQMIERWGREVTGEIPTDSFGFPLESDEDKI